MPLIIAASLLNARSTRLAEEAHAVLAAGADRLHLDIMDQHYVPGLSFGPSLCTDLRQEGITCPIDVHLMTRPAQALAHAFIDAGADTIMVHTDCGHPLPELLQTLRERHTQVGLVLNPDEPLHRAAPYLDLIDHLLLMSVPPGRGGQTLCPEVLTKAKQAHDRWPDRLTLELDGGIHAETLPQVRATGVQRVVIGSAIFQSTDDYATTLNNLRRNA